MQKTGDDEDDDTTTKTSCTNAAITGLLMQKPLKFNTTFPIIPRPSIKLLHLPKFHRKQKVTKTSRQGLRVREGVLVLAAARLSPRSHFSLSVARDHHDGIEVRQHGAEGLGELFERFRRRVAR
jgi:hypothetical protein